MCNQFLIAAVNRTEHFITDQKIIIHKILLLNGTPANLHLIVLHRCVDIIWAGIGPSYVRDHITDDRNLLILVGGFLQNMLPHSQLPVEVEGLKGCPFHTVCHPCVLVDVCNRAAGAGFVDLCLTVAVGTTKLKTPVPTKGASSKDKSYAYRL